MNKIVSRQITLSGKENQNSKFTVDLLAQCGKTDREVAKVLGVNNSTLSKRRRKLEREGYIKEYTFLPDFHKLGLEVIVFSFSSTTEVVPEENSKLLRELAQNTPEMLCLFEDHDAAGTNWFAITVHKSYDDFVELSKKIQNELINLPRLPHIESKRLVFHTNKLGPKPFSLRNMEALFQPTQPITSSKKRKHNTEKPTVF